MLKRYDGANFVDVKMHCKRYDGTKWVQVEKIRRYDGSQWVDRWHFAAKPDTLHYTGQWEKFTHDVNGKYYVKLLSPGVLTGLEGQTIDVFLVGGGGGGGRGGYETGTDSVQAYGWSSWNGGGGGGGGRTYTKKISSIPAPYPLRQLARAALPVQTVPVQSSR